MFLGKTWCLGFQILGPCTPHQEVKGILAHLPHRHILNSISNNNKLLWSLKIQTFVKLEALARKTLCQRVSLLITALQTIYKLVGIVSSNETCQLSVQISVSSWKVAERKKWQACLGNKDHFRWIYPRPKLLSEVSGVVEVQALRGCGNFLLLNH